MKKLFTILCALALALGVTIFTATPALASVTVTPATGGTSISADSAGGTYTSLGYIRIAEGSNSDFASSQTNKTLILTAPGGFQFNAAQTPSISYTTSRDITSATVAISATQITVTFSTDGYANRSDTITIGATTAIQVRPAAGTPLANGQIYRATSNPGTGTINGIITTNNTNGSGGTNFGTLTEVTGALDHFNISTISSPQTAGTAITGITLTAKDTNNNTVTGFASTVTYGGTAGITGTSGSFTAGQLTGVSVTPIISGTSRTFTVTASGKTGTSTFNVNPAAPDAAQSTLTPTSASIAANGISTQILTVQARDASGNNTTSGGATVVITKLSGTGSIGAVTDNGNGTYTATVTSPNTTGSGTFAATLNGNPVKSGTGSQTQAVIVYTGSVPVVISAASSADGSMITLAFSTNMSNPAGNAGAFKYQINSGPDQPFGAIYLNADISKIDLVTAGAPFTGGDTVTISYVPGTVQSVDTSLLEAFSSRAVINNVPVTNPKVVSAATNFTGSVITITFSKNMANPAGKQDQFKYQINGGADQPFSAAALNGNPAKIDLTAAGTAIAYGDNVTVSYTAGTIQSADTGVLMSFSGQLVANNVAAPLTINAAADSGGTISPSGLISTAYNGNQSFIITANPGYFVSNVVVDGVSQGAIGAYSFTNVTASHTIYATFYTTSVASTVNGNVPAGQANAVVDATSTTGTSVTVSTNAQPVSITVIQYAGNPHPEATLPPNALPQFKDVIVSNLNAVVWPLYVEIRYTDAEILGRVEPSMRMYYFKNGAWHVCSSTGVDTAGNFVWAYLTQYEAEGSPLTFTGDPEGGPTAVGGTVFRADKLQVLMPYPVLTALILFSAGSTVYLFKKRRNAR